MSKGTWLTPAQKADKAFMAERRRRLYEKKKADQKAARAAAKLAGTSTRKNQNLKKSPYSSTNCRPVLKGDLILVPQVAGLYNLEYPALCMGCRCNLNKYNLGPVFNDVPLSSRTETPLTIKILCKRCYRAWPALPGANQHQHQHQHQHQAAGHAV